jgi:hypothetical protein
MDGKYFYDKPDKYWETRGETHSIGIRWKPEKGRALAAFTRIIFNQLDTFSMHKSSIDHIVNRLNAGQLKEADFKSRIPVEKAVNLYL